LAIGEAARAVVAVVRARASVSVVVFMGSFFLGPRASCPLLLFLGESDVCCSARKSGQDARGLRK
jgi:hypothetical protein